MNTRPLYIKRDTIDNVVRMTARATIAALNAPSPGSGTSGGTETVAIEKPFWAKTTPEGLPGTSVQKHCLAAGMIAQQLVSLFPEDLRERLMLESAGVTLAALHDVGKVSPGFQSKCQAWLRERKLVQRARQWHVCEMDHGKVTQRTLQCLLSGDSALRYWAAAAGAHHGHLKHDFIAQLDSVTENWTPWRKKLAIDLASRFGGLPARPPPKPEWNHAALWACAGLIAVADWLASDERTFPPEEELKEGEIEIRAARTVAQTGFDYVHEFEEDLGFDRLFGFDSPNAMQTLVAEGISQPGVYVIEAPTGSGKTEAALAAAYSLLAAGHATGLYFALPTQTTSNRMHHRVKTFLGKLGAAIPPRLIHGNSWLAMDGNQIPEGRQSDEEAPYAGRDWFASSRRALLAPFGVGTVDQALLGIVAARHFFVRQFALAGKVVILDEIHSYDLYTGTLVDQLVRRLRELDATVIILSATLTRKRRCKLLGLPQEGKPETHAAQADPYPMLSSTPVHGSPSSIRCEVPEEQKRVRFQFEAAHTLIDSSMEMACKGACVLWIRNTVDEAQQTWRELQSANRQGGPEVGLLHARFPLFLREQLETRWLDALGKDHSKRPAEGCIVVSTQVAEQSVDIDADLLVTDLAPTDMLIQRLGRLWRHPPSQRPLDHPMVWIQLPAIDLDDLTTADVSAVRHAFGKTGRVYAPYVLLRTLAEWRHREELAIPREIRAILEATYAEPSTDEPASWTTLHEALRDRCRKMRMCALGNTNPWNVGLRDEEGVQTRWNNCPRTPVLPLVKLSSWSDRDGAHFRLLDGAVVRINPYQFALDAAKAIHRNVVHVPAWTVRDVNAAQLATLSRHAPRRTVPLKLLEDGTLCALSGDATCLSWNEAEGVIIHRQQPTTTEHWSQYEDYDDEPYD